MKNNKKQKGYFDANKFVHVILQDMGMLNAEPEILDQLNGEITALLSERVIATVITKFGDKELFLLENLLKDHPELDEIDAISIIAENLPGLNELILKTVDDLHAELVENAKMVEKKVG